MMVHFIKYQINQNKSITMTEEKENFGAHNARALASEVKRERLKDVDVTHLTESIKSSVIKELGFCEVRQITPEEIEKLDELGYIVSKREHTCRIFWNTESLMTP